MRIVRKLSRKKFFGKVMYEYERFLVPVPSRFRDVMRLWHGLDMRVFSNGRNEKSDYHSQII